LELLCTHIPSKEFSVQVMNSIVFYSVLTVSGELQYGWVTAAGGSGFKKMPERRKCMDALGQPFRSIEFIQCHRAVQPLTAISKLARTTFPSLNIRTDHHCALEKQPRNADH